jgi:hypothetical protein
MPDGRLVESDANVPPDVAGSLESSSSLVRDL